MSLSVRCFSSSRGCGLARRFLPEDDSDSGSGSICRWGVRLVELGWVGAEGGVVRGSSGRGSGPWGDDSGGPVRETRPRLGGG